MICTIGENHAFLSLPEIFFDYPRLESIAIKYKEQGIRLSISSGIIKNMITLEINDNDAALIVREIFSRYHNIDINFLGHNIPLKSYSEPLISCIILLNANYDFVRELTIPSIIFNSGTIPIEIIVVHNGKKEKFEKVEGVRYVGSETQHLPKGYNNGAYMARGKYLAFFHDDCFLSDDKWIDKSISVLDEDVIAVGPEYHKFITNEDYKLRKDVDKHREFRNEHGGFLKEVPLVMEKEKFRELKGFPSEEIFGQEDIFLHQNILNSGRKNLEIDIKNYHFEGISTLSLFSTQEDLIQKLCNHFIFDKVILRGLIKHGFTTTISERMDLCKKLLKYNLNDEEHLSMCEKIEAIGNAENLDKMTPNFKYEDKRTKAFLDGAVKAFVTISDKKGLEIIENFAEFNEVLFNYINAIKNNA